MPVLLLDEVDSLLSVDWQNEQKLAGTWRKLAQEGVCHFVFVGTATLAWHLRNSTSVFFNFPQRIALKYLDSKIAAKVINTPLAMLGLSLKPSNLLDTVLDFASGHPNLLQTLGKRLVEQASYHQTRYITPHHWETVMDDSDFINFYLDVMWGIVQPLEKLVLLIAPATQFTITNLEAALDSHNIVYEPEALDAALYILEVYALINQKGRTYQFNPTQFKPTLTRTQDVERLIRIEKKKVNSE